MRVYQYFITVFIKVINFVYHLIVFVHNNNTTGIDSGTVPVGKGLLKIWHIGIPNFTVRVILLTEVQTIGVHFISVFIRFGDLFVKDQFTLIVKLEDIVG